MARISNSSLLVSVILGTCVAAWPGLGLASSKADQDAAALHLTQYSRSSSHSGRHMVALRPVSPRQANAPQLKIAQGQYFSYALPPAWRVGEEGPYALSLVSPDNKALTFMVGNSGLQPNYPAQQYVYQTLMALRPQQLQLNNPRPARPLRGFSEAVEFDIMMIGRQGATNIGVAKCSIAQAYDSALYVVTAAISERSQWSSFASWLPLVGEQISATNGAAFGRRGVMAQNLRNSEAFGEALRRYNDFSQKNWQSVVDQRNASQDRHAYEFRQGLGGTANYVNPFDASQPLVEFNQQYKYIWVNREGQYQGTNDPSENPNHGSTQEWRQMRQYHPQ